MNKTDALTPGVDELSILLILIMTNEVILSMQIYIIKSNVSTEIVNMNESRRFHNDYIFPPCRAFI